MVYLSTFTIKINQKWVNTPVPWIIWVSDYFFMPMIWVKSFSSLSVSSHFGQIPCKNPPCFFTMSTGLSGQKLHPVNWKDSLPLPSIPSPTNRRWKVENPPFPPIRKRIAPKPWKTSLVSSNITSRGKVSVAKNDFLETPGSEKGFPWEWCRLNCMERNHKNHREMLGKYTVYHTLDGFGQWNSMTNLHPTFMTSREKGVHPKYPNQFLVGMSTN